MVFLDQAGYRCLVKIDHIVWVEFRRALALRSEIGEGTAGIIILTASNPNRQDCQPDQPHGHLGLGLAGRGVYPNAATRTSTTSCSREMIADVESPSPLSAVLSHSSPSEMTAHGVIRSGQGEGQEEGRRRLLHETTG